jgi:hypothetical protein
MTTLTCQQRLHPAAIALFAPGLADASLWAKPGTSAKDRRGQTGYVVSAPNDAGPPGILEK